MGSARSGMIEFEAEIVASGRGRAAVVVPLEVLERLGGGGRVPVTSTFDGVPYSGSIVRRGDDFYLGAPMTIRKEIGKDVGDKVAVTLKADKSIRKVVIPEELAIRFASHPGAVSAFAELSFSHQKEHVNYIAEAKKPATRNRRAQLTVERLLSW